jgi:MFS family permease
MIIYTPIYLRDLGFSWVDIGKIFTTMLLPFVLLQYVIGYWADNKIGEKKLLIFALLVMGCSTTTIYFVESKTILTWMIILFTTRIGASMIEILRDSYFYKKIDRTDVDLINFFRTALPVAYICATASSSFLFLFLPVKFAFILTGIVVLSAIYPAYYLINNKVKR